MTDETSGFAPEGVGPVVDMGILTIARPLRTCTARVGLYLDGAVPVAASYGNAETCGEPATVVERIGCVHEHVKLAHSCAGHAGMRPPGGAVFCRECAAGESAHYCPVTIEDVTLPGGAW